MLNSIPINAIYFDSGSIIAGIIIVIAVIFSSIMRARNSGAWRDFLDDIFGGNKTKGTK
jgi:hypothetical protein